MLLVQPLGAALSDLADFLDRKGWPERATWVRQRATLSTGSSDDLATVADEVLPRIAGMGSLSDIPMPDADAQQELDNLLERVWRAAKAVSHATHIRRP